VLLATRRNTEAARAFFTRALAGATIPVEVTTDRAPVYPRLIDELTPGARHVLEQYANNATKQTTAGSKHGCDPCADSNATGPPQRSPPGTRSCRTCDAATTNSPPTRRPAIASESRSTNSPTASNPEPDTVRATTARSVGPTQQSPRYFETRTLNRRVTNQRLG
jgi:hypothetical protein